MKRKGLLGAVVVAMLLLATGCDLFGGAGVDTACASDKDCKNSYCNVETGLCVDCVTDEQCPTNRYCEPEQNVCVACYEDAQCKGDVCDTSKNYCVECLENSQCPSGQCDEEKAICIECGTDAECTEFAGPCSAGVCVEGQCAKVQLPDGTACEDNDKCTLGDTCAAGKCAPGPKDPACSTDPGCTGKEDGTPCDDANECTVDDMCLKGVCSGEGVPGCGLEDLDKDGFSVKDGDCNDDDPTIFPGAKEACDGLDNDCDGEVDEGCTVECVKEGQAYTGETPDENLCCPGLKPVSDAEEILINDCEPNGNCGSGFECQFPKCFCFVCVTCGDGKCGPGENRCNCEKDCLSTNPDDVDGDGFLAPEDCNDFDATVFPGAPEVCDGVDNDCNGLVDELGCGGECIVTGCSGQLCAPFPMDSTCEWLPEYDCLKYSKCGNFGLNGECGWLQTPEYLKCLQSVCVPAPEVCDGIDNDCNGLVDEFGCGNECGGFMGLPCLDGQVCIFPPGTCNWADMMGTCYDVPWGCEKIYKPVCGCDGVTYDNECFMTQAGMSMDYTGPCQNGGECQTTCDCYDIYGMTFSNPCPLMCANCDNYWQCVEGKCQENCGFVPPDAQECLNPCLPEEKCFNGLDDNCNGLIDEGCENCVKETGTYLGSSSNDNQCCPGLKPMWDCKEQPVACIPEDPTCEGFTCSCPKCLCYICVACGDGLCGPGENQCNCPDDCAPPTGCLSDTECEDGDICTKDYCDLATGLCVSALIPGCVGSCASDKDCQFGSYCQFPDGSCNDPTMPGKGTCVKKPTICPDLYKPVCGCDGKTYGNYCEMQAAGVSMSFEGECTPPCTPEGQNFMGSGECCPGSKPISQCSMDIVCDPATGKCTPQCACLKCLCFTCANCGNGICGPGENFCNCAADCKPPECTGDANCSDGNACTVDACVNGLCVHKTPPELCGDGKDNDCDGKIDEDCAAGCGGIAGLGCPAGQYCSYADGTCGIADQLGVCAPVPQVCPLVYDPVCGCDGKTYENSCVAASAKVSVKYKGACK